jgi:hypothetical protein
MNQQIALQERSSGAGDTEIVIHKEASGAYEPEVQNRPVSTYISFEDVFEGLNGPLCGGVLRPPLITLGRVGANGSFSPGSVANTENPSEIADRIVLPRNRAGTLLEQFALLARNMLHLWQHHHPDGKPSRPGYSNEQLCKLMTAVGLPPYVIDKRDGAKLYGKPGDSVQHEIQPDGLFARICGDLIARRNTVLFLDRAFSDAEEDENAARVRAKKAESKTRFICVQFRREADEDLTDPTKIASDHYKQKVWGHGKTNVRCGFCLSAMSPG